MTVAICLTMLILWASQDSTHCETTEVPLDTVRVAIGQPFTLNCTYNCSPGFLRGCWRTEQESDCKGTTNDPNNGVCTVSFHFPNMSTEDVRSVYICFSENTADRDLKRHTERRVALYIQDHRNIPSWTTGSDKASYKTKWTEMTTASIPTQPKDSGAVTGRIAWQTVITVVAVVTAVGIVVYLFVMCKGNGCPVDSIKNRPTSKGSHANSSDDQRDSEVAYAEIVITVRGASAPDLAQICYGSQEDQRVRWRDEAYLSPFPASHLLQISRSADRLNAVPREVSRKLSTNSEYAIITYS